MITFLDENDVEYGALTTLKTTNAVNGERSISGEIISGDYVLGHIERGWRLRFEGEYYVITYAKPIDGGRQTSVSFDAVHQFFWDFDKSSVHSQLKDGSHTFDAYLEFIFKGSGYRYTVDSLLKVSAFSKQSFGYKKRLTLFNDIIKSTGVEFSVSGKVVRILAKAGTDLSTVVRKNFNLNELGVEKNIGDFVTYQKGFGAWNDSEDHSKGRLEVEYESPLASVYGRLEAEPLVDERYTIGENMLSVLKENVDNSYTISVKIDMEDLTKAGYEYTQPRAGDYIMAINETLGFQEKVRLVSYVSEYDVKGALVKHEVTCNDIGSVKKQSAGYSAAKKQMQSTADDLDKVLEVANRAMVSADGKNTVYFGEEMPVDLPKGTLKSGDTLYLKVGDATKLYYWNGGTWEEVLDTEDVDKVKKEVESLKEEGQNVRQEIQDGIEEAKATAEVVRAEIGAEVEAVAREGQAVKQAVDAGLAQAKQEAQVFEESVHSRVAEVETKANQVADQARQSDQKAVQALTKAGTSETLAQTAKDTADRALRQAGDNLRTVQERANQLQADLDTAKRSITSQARDILNQAQAQQDLTSRLQTVETTANGTKTTVTELTKTVNTATGNLASVTQRVASTEIGLTSVRDQYSQLSQTVSGQTGQITAVTRQTADLQRGLDGVTERFEKLSVGARNYAEDYDFSRSMWEYSQGDSSPQNWSVRDGIYTVNGTTNTWRQYQLYSESGGRLGGKKDSTALLELEVGQTYTLSVEAKCISGSPNLWIELRDNGSANYNNIVTHAEIKLTRVTSDWKRYSVTFSVKPNSDFGYRRIILGYSEIGSVAFRKVELVKGLITTDAGPADEDIRQELATYIRTATENTSRLEQSIQTADGKAEGAKTLAQQTAQGLALKAEKTSLDTVTGRLETAESTIAQQADQISQRLTSSQVESAITAKGYQTKDQIDSNITGRGYITNAALAGYVPATSFDNYKVETAQAIERGLTATQALIPTEFSGNILKDGNQVWRNARGATYTLDDELEADRDYTLTVKFRTGAGGQAVSSNVFGHWIIGSYDQTIDAWVIRGRSSTKIAKGTTFHINAHPVTGLGNADWATLTKGSLAMSKYQEPFSNLVTSVDFNRVKETAQLYERVIGRSEGDIQTNVARQVLTSQLYQTEVTNANWDSRNYIRNGTFAANGNHWTDNTANSGLSVNYDHSKASDNRRRSGVHIYGTANNKWKGLHQLVSLKALAGQKLTLSALLSRDGTPTGNLDLGLHYIKDSVIVNQVWRYISPNEIKQGHYDRYVWTVTLPVDVDEVRLLIQAEPLKNINYYLTEISFAVSDRFVGYAEALEDTEALGTRVTQLADSYGIKVLGNKEKILSELNLNTGGVRLAGKLIHLDGTVTASDAFFRSVLADKIEAGNIKAGAVTTATIAANAVTADHLLVNQAMIDKLVTNSVWADRLFAQTAFMTKLQAVKIKAGQIDAGLINTDMLATDAVTADHLLVNQAMIDKLVTNSIWAERLFAQSAVINKIKTVELNAGKVTAGTLDAANVNIINLNVNKLVGLDADFIKAKIESALVDWLRGKVITAQNDAMRINLNQANISFNQNATIEFNSANNAIKRVRGHVMGFVQFSDDPKGGVYANIGVSSHDVGLRYDNDFGKFAGMRIQRSDDNNDNIKIYGDTIELRHGSGGKAFISTPTSLRNNVNLNQLAGAVYSLAKMFIHLRANGYNLNQGYIDGLKSESSRGWIDNFVNAGLPL